LAAISPTLHVPRSTFYFFTAYCHCYWGLDAGWNPANPGHILQPRHAVYDESGESGRIISQIKAPEFPGAFICIDASTIETSAQSLS